MATKGDKSRKDKEEEGTHDAPAADESDGSLCYSDAEDKSCHSPYGSNCASSAYDEYRFSAASSHEIDLESGVSEACRNSCVSSSSLEVDIKSGVSEIKVNVDKVERDCRICHLSLESPTRKSGVPIELGCSCKDDLAAAHMQCAETWFKIKGNKVCEICGSTARNVVSAVETEVVEHWNETSTVTVAPAPSTETRRFWQGHRVLNFLLACMVFAFVISWLFHFNVPG